MRKRRILCLISAALICFGLLLLPATASAAPPNVSFAGKAERFVFFEDDDPFLTFAEIVPGDSVTRNFRVRNTSGIRAALFMKAEPVSIADRALLERLNIKIALPPQGTVPEQVLYSGPVARMAEQDPFDEFIQFGVGSNIDVELTATLTVPTDLGNEYMGRSAEFRWTFRAEDRTITPPDTELPEVKTPRTGSQSWAEIMRMPFAVLLIVCGLILLIPVLRRKKELRV
jgi:hypothetical protein